MQIREGNDFIEIEVVDRDPVRGDFELSVAASSAGFVGNGFAWVEGTHLADFVERLAALDETRQGSATLNSMSLGKLQFEILSVDRRGRLALRGRVTRDVNRDGSRPCRHSVEFGFEFDPTLLPRILKEFRLMANRGNGSA